ncbi:phosphotransferase [Leptodontidium sp. MPI-SDFR-AT-0119]|nr:phosphotransferase [Leptodontidium sp. MPI-SDFR-AT-0119]
MGDTREDFDNLIWDRNDEEWEKTQPELRQRSAIQLVEELITKKFGCPSNWIAPMNIGGYNIVYRLRVPCYSSDVMVRRPIPCYAQFPKEKTSIEAATASYIEKQTQIPIAPVLFHGQTPELGHYLILKYIEHQHSMSTALNATNDDTDKTFVLDANISEDFLEDLYRKVASCLLELSQHTFARIGSLVESSDGSYSVAARPITRNMNDMLQLAGIPPSILPPKNKTYENKYVARQIFRRLAREGKISTFGFKEDNWSAQSKTMRSISSPTPAGPGSFLLYCDDLRAGNSPLDDSNNIAAIIDWEFTYAAPSQFSLDPPWWLDWVKFYEPRMMIWLSAMEKAEATSDFEVMRMETPLSTYMRESWETGRFWLTYAARRSWAFDALFWSFLDERLHLLSEAERIAMEPFVERKMDETKERRLVEWTSEAAEMRVAEILLD